MKNAFKVLCALSLLSAVACGDDDGDDNNNKPDSGGPAVTPVDASRPMDSSIIDANMNSQPDTGTGTTNPPPGGGTGCSLGTPATQAAFLNRCSPANVQTANKPTLGIPANKLDANGKVLPL